MGVVDRAVGAAIFAGTPMPEKATKSKDIELPVFPPLPLFPPLSPLAKPKFAEGEFSKFAEGKFP